MKKLGLLVDRSFLAATLLAVAANAGASFAVAPAHAITRDEVLTRARAFAFHPWRMASANKTASCNTSYESVYQTGDYVGLPYDWGGYMGLWEFDQQIAQGYGAGSYPGDGVLACTAGLDCSGFVSQSWDTGHYTTRNLATISSGVATASLLPGDIFNMSGYHVAMFSHRVANGTPILYEAIDYNVHINVTGGWSHVEGYTPLRYRNITGTTDTNPLGTVTNPIPIGAFPFTDTRDTRNSTSSVLDRCAAAADKNESGPEYVYRANLTQPGTLTVSVSDDVGVDIDVHLYRSANTSDCVARHDSTFTRTVGCGEHLIVADTFGTGTTNAGRYTLNVTFTPSGTSCGTVVPAYDFQGGPGDACEYPGNPNLPFCNPNLGVETCLYTTSPAASYCTHPCTGNADCSDFPGGCCKPIGGGESYCTPSNRCGGDGGVVRLDGGIRGGGDPELDAGVGPIDAGVRDAGVVVVDAGVRDAGVVVVDAGVRDAGVVVADAGVRDAGVRDAGVVAPLDAGVVIEDDAGVAPPRDAGTTPRDAGVDGGRRRDAGVPLPTEETPAPPSGCAAAGGGDASFLFGLFAVLAAFFTTRRNHRRGDAGARRT